MRKRAPIPTANGTLGHKPVDSAGGNYYTPILIVEMGTIKQAVLADRRAEGVNSEGRQNHGSGGESFGTLQDLR